MAFDLGTSQECVKECAQRVFKKLKVNNRYDLLITYLSIGRSGVAHNANAGVG